ncbi:MAG TPA: hypothetical protein VGQ86_10385 [Candidatus Limnocylindria bacterium]|nr:hypothetical protein [Candidatus Limnocylindria bacterium]
MATAVASQSKTNPDTIEQERPWTAGSVWSVDFIRLKPGHTLEYGRELAATWKKALEENKKQGLVLSYKILTGMPSNREDFTHMLMVEYPNYAVFDQQDRIDATLKKVFGSLGGFQEMFRKREEIREAIGTRLLREMHLK